ncbi:alpha/beta fold hydrolase [Dyella psychrodurans]|uniref:Alpha/beta hydrolase n=1 Tax=Dyella psychrodurans TaxID=1927960 RepID=A0A370WV30_9GAMM|nr:alpha/beta hydrolase [Dyella psychrodurans]RDS79998.1 alpha/beta hydrolase [Dyella psychrodurans]
MTPASQYLTCEGREIHYMEWGSQHTETVIAWHGLTRNGRDMDYIARHLAQRRRVICPDTLGRGLSQWSPIPEVEYSLAFYEKLAVALVNGVGAKDVLWLGTSMGGAIGMMATVGGLKGRIRKLVLNDFGPVTNPVAIARIKAYGTQLPVFRTMTQLEQFFREAYEPFGWISDEQWRLIAETSMRRLPDGRVTPHYDPKIMYQIVHRPRDRDLRDTWNRIDIPVLCLRGEHSDLLLAEAAEQMKDRAQVVTIPGCGHAPALNTPEQYALIENFFDHA